MDEIFIKSDLVYDKHEGSLIGFVNIGDINNRILEFETMLENGETANPPLAATMMMLMVRGLLHKFNYLYAQYACGKGVVGDLIFDPIWEAVT